MFFFIGGYFVFNVFFEEGLLFEDFYLVFFLLKLRLCLFLKGLFIDME